MEIGKIYCYLSHLKVSQKTIGATTAFRNHIGHIPLNRRKKQMFRIDTKRSIASMADKLPLQDWPLKKGISNAVCSVLVKAAVTICIYATYPKPAIRGFINFFQKPFLLRFHIPSPNPTAKSELMAIDKSAIFSLFNTFFGIRVGTDRCFQSTSTLAKAHIRSLS